MIVNCLSIKNPLSYLVAAGVKDVENRTWQTPYRGKLYIHSSGQYDYFCYDESHNKMLGAEVFERVNALPDADRHTIAMGRFYDWQCQKYGLDSLFYKDANFAAYEKYGPQIISHAIIGTVDLIDVVKDSGSPWGEKNCYHWILENAELFDKPIRGVEGRLKIFQTNI